MAKDADGVDRADKLDEVVLALLYRNSFVDHGIMRAWKNLNWGSLDRLRAGGLMYEPRSKAKSVASSDEGARRAAELCQKHFGEAA